MASKLGTEYVEIQSESQVIVSHIQGVFEVQRVKMKQCLSLVQDATKQFKHFSIIKILREHNEKADRLARLGSTTDEEIEAFEESVQIFSKPTITESISVFILEVVPTWASKIIKFIKDRIDPANQKKKAVHLRTKVARFMMVGDALYKRGFMLPLLKCVSQEEADYILWEIHEGVWKSLGSKNACAQSC